MSSHGIRAAKAALRISLRQTLADLPEDTLVSESTAVAKQVLSSPWYQSASRLSCYISMPRAELRTDAIIEDALAQGKAVFVPYCPADSKTEMRMLRLRDEATFAGLKPNRWGIREFAPGAVDDLEEALDPAGPGLDLIIMPGLAFDVFANRLGHGRGYYDRYLGLAATRQPMKRPFVAALCLSAQLLPPGSLVPTDVTDLKPDLLVTPGGELEKLAYQGG